MLATPLHQTKIAYAVTDPLAGQQVKYRHLGDLANVEKIILMYYYMRVDFACVFPIS
jgi:hypothetical protein